MFMLKRVPGPSAIVLLTAVALVGCAGDGPPPQSDQTWIGQIQREVFDPSCATAACHSASTRAAGLSLAPGESYDQLVDVEPQNPAARAAGLLLVRPGSVEQSFLVHKLTGDLAAGEGSLMPLLAPPLAADLIADIEAWIAAGASPDAPAPGGGGGSGGGDDPPSPETSDFALIQTEIFDRSCATAGCHDDVTRAADLSLAAGQSWLELVDQRPSSAAARDAGLLLVVPDAPEQSFLLLKVEGPLEAGEGTLMPLGAPPLSPADIERLRAWIAAGAEPDA